jgi:hypothetical protein
MIKQVEGLVYESPDGGNTVYARQAGSIERTLVYKSPASHLINRHALWRDILSIAPQYPSLDKAIRDAELIYEIVKKEET